MICQWQVSRVYGLFTGQNVILTPYRDQNDQQDSFLMPVWCV